MLQTVIDINFWIILGSSIGMLIFALGIVAFMLFHQRRVIKYQVQLQYANEEKQTQMMQAAIQSEEQERSRIGTELHDDVGAQLSAIKLYLNQIQPEHFSNPDKIKTLETCKSLLDETVTSVRNLAANFQPAIIYDFGLVSALQHFCDKLNMPPMLECRLTVLQTINRFDKNRELASFRIVQELTNNILKHAKAKSIHIHLSISPEQIMKLLIYYDGNGLSQQQYEEKLYNSSGLGLKNIQNRLTALKSTIHFEKNVSEPNSVLCEIPLTI